MTEENEEINDPAAVLAALDRAKKDAEKYRGLYEETKNEGDQKYRQRALQLEARLALSSQGIKNPEKLMKHFNLSGLDYDEDDNVTGLEEGLKALKEDLPELFSPKHRAPAVDQFDKKTNVDRKESSSEKQARLAGIRIDN